MTTKHKVIWSIRSILVVALLIEVGIYWKVRHAESQARGLNMNLDILDEKLESLESKMAENCPLMGPFQHLPMPANKVKKTYYDKQGESLIQDVDKEKGLVLVTTFDSKISIVFKPSDDAFQKFRVGSIAPVTFQCTKKKKGKCDFSSPYKLFVSNGLVEVKQLEFPKK